MGVQLKNWNEAGRLLETLPGRLDRRIDEVLMKNAELYRDSVLRLIQSGDSSWTPKGKDSAQRTGNRLFIGSTGTFYANLANRGIRRVRAGAGQKRIYVGARYDIQHSPSGMNMEKLAKILQNTPGEGDRDLFGPAWERVQAQVRRNLSRIGADLV